MLLLAEAEGDSPHHIVVQCAGRIFCMEILDDSGDIISPSEILQQLTAITSQCEEQGEGPAIGALTAMHRTRFYEVNAPNKIEGFPCTS